MKIKIVPKNEHKELYKQRAKRAIDLFVRAIRKEGRERDGN